MPELKRIYKTGGSTVLSLSPGALSHMGVSPGDYIQVIILPGGALQLVPVTKTTIVPGYGPRDIPSQPLL